MNKNETQDTFQEIRLGRELDDATIKAHIKSLNKRGDSLLHEAISYNNYPTAKKLIQFGVDVDKSNNDGSTPLHFAAESQNVDLVKIIASNTNNINAVDKHGNSPMWVAVFNARGNYSIVEVLKEHKARVDTRNKYGKSPLDFATQIGDNKLLAILKE